MTGVVIEQHQSPNKKSNNKIDDIATSYRAACEKDSSLLLESNLPNYYLVPAEWMNNFISQVSSNPPQEKDEWDEKKDSNGNEIEDRPKLKISKIDNSEMIGGESSSGFSGVGIRPGLRHGKDYALVGSNAWKVLQRFGYDLAISRPVIDLVDGKHAVEVYPRSSGGINSFVTLPLSGRWELSTGSVGVGVGGDSVGISGGDLMDDDRNVVIPEDDLFPEHSHSPVDMDSSPVLSSPTPLLLLPPPDTSTTTIDTNRTMSGARLLPPIESSRKKPRQSGRCGLGNLGNTCFMNSSLQCLAHTDPLRHYFLSGAYRADLNKSNPLGTGGELATEFARLLEEMWSGDCHYDSVVYPRLFKSTLGRHAEQFIGYDQHDSQELACYLLDALHEDTNRVTKKPYFEKPEQESNETDEEAAKKAWELHLQREDSRVLQAFMGQVKSRVECPVSGCNRVSTTFDPFMYLSVPIPGATDRVMSITFVPLDPNAKRRKIEVTVSRHSTISSLNEKIVHALSPDLQIEKEDICLADVWTNEVYTFFGPNEEVSRIRDSDQTYAFQLTSLYDLQKDELNGDTDTYRTLEADPSGGLVDQLEHSDLDPNLKVKLARNDKWMGTMDRYVKNTTYWNALLNNKRGTHEERMSFLNKLQKFVQKCSACPDASPSYDEEQDDPMLPQSPKPGSTNISLSEVSFQSTMFKNIEERKDLLVLNYCGRLFYDFTMRLFREVHEKNKNGVVIQVVMKKECPASRGLEKVFTSSLVLRVSSRMTVYGLRKLIGKRLARVLGQESLFTSAQPPTTSSDPAAVVGMSEDSCTSSEGSINDTSMQDGADIAMDKEPEPINRLDMVYPLNDDVETLILSRIPLSYQRKSTYNYSSSHQTPRPLGSLQLIAATTSHSDHNNPAYPDNEEEQQLVADVVGNLGTVIMHWSNRFADECFNQDEWEALEVPPPQASPVKENKKQINVVDCIEKYCQEEQLEESEMWYCNRCKAHVRAWKQFHLYSSPPILIIHLKRFHYSSSTHRREKIDTFIDFPLVGLDLTPYVMSCTPGQEPIYDCYAVSNHYGGLGGGHYTAYAKNNSQWCHFDDSKVTEGIHEDDVVSAAAYVLYYRRRDVNAWEWDQSQTQIPSNGSAASISEESTGSNCAAAARADFSVSSSNNDHIVSNSSANIVENDKMNKMVVAMDHINNADTYASPLEDDQSDIDDNYALDNPKISFYNPVNDGEITNQDEV